MLMAKYYKIHLKKKKKLYKISNLATIILKTSNYVLKFYTKFQVKVDMTIHLI